MKTPEGEDPFLGEVQRRLAEWRKRHPEPPNWRSTLKGLMEQGHTRILNGREIILAKDKYGRIGWVFKDTGLVPTEGDMKPRKKEKK